MKKRTRMLVMTLALAMTISLCACGSSTQDSAVQEAGSMEPVSEAAPETASAPAETPEAALISEAPAESEVPPEPSNAPAPTVTMPEPTKTPAPTDTPPEPTQAPAESEATPEPTKTPAPTDTPPDPTKAPAEPEATPEPSKPPEKTPEPTKEVSFPTEGVYHLFAMETDGFLVDPEALERSAVLTLEKDVGSLVLETPASSEAIDFSSWTVQEDQLTVTADDGSSATGVIRSGVIELDLIGTGDSLLYFAREGADRSGYAVLSGEEYQEAYEAAHDSRLYALAKELDSEAGIHLRYRQHTDFLDSTQDFDVHSKEGIYYSLRTTEALGQEVQRITFLQDGTAYNLYPEDMTGIIVTSTSSEIVLSSPILMDSLYKAIWTRAQEIEYTVEDREMDGKTYSVEVFPGSDLQAETAFYYDDDGKLAYCLEGVPPLTPEMGETLYTIAEINDQVDETLFDISGYDIS